jgi:hypothetical protein
MVGADQPPVSSVAAPSAPAPPFHQWWRTPRSRTDVARPRSGRPAGRPSSPIASPGRPPVRRLRRTEDARRGTATAGGGAGPVRRAARRHHADARRRARVAVDGLRGRSCRARFDAVPRDPDLSPPSAASDGWRSSLTRRRHVEQLAGRAAVRIEQRSDTSCRVLRSGSGDQSRPPAPETTGSRLPNFRRRSPPARRAAPRPGDRDADAALVRAGGRRQDSKRTRCVRRGARCRRCAPRWDRSA